MANALITPAYAANTLPQEQLAAIGDIVVRWGRLEWQFANLLTMGFNIPKDTGRALLIGAEISTLCGMSRTLTFTDNWIKDRNLRKEISELSEEIKGKSSHRHAYAHGVFGFDMESPNTFARYLFHSKQHRVTPSHEPIVLEQLQQLVDEAQNLVDRTVDLTVRLKASRRKSKRLHRSPPSRPLSQPFHNP